MEILQGLPVWVQLVVAFLVAAVLIFMNIGWLIQARAWLQRQWPMVLAVLFLLVGGALTTLGGAGLLGQ